MFVIGTAGHVDHGKSLLVEALTGIDPDRLREEKVRGMTIDLGFAWLTLPSGRSVSIVDVPGHERFIKNMLAGVGGIDLALLVVAADDGVMPQTREHLAILDLLGVSCGVVALTKRDLASDDWLTLVEAEIATALRGTALEDSPIIPCSARARVGLDALLTAIDAAVGELPAKRDIGKPRLPIDRVFTIGGFGTVVTGTLIEGELSIGEDIEVMPGGLRGRVRGLQSHKDSVDRALPGTRTAVNIAGIERDALRRGMVLARPDTLRSTSVLDVRVRAVAPLRHNMRVTFHTGAAEANAQIRLLNADRLESGGEGWAQIKLDAPVALERGDHFVVRTPNDTVGGGVIADLVPKRHRRRHQPTLDALAASRSDAPADRALDAIARSPLAERAAIARSLPLEAVAANAAIDELIARGVVRTFGDDAHVRLATLAFAEEARRQVTDILTSYHTEHPLRRGMPVEELRARLDLDARALQALLDTWTDVRIDGAVIAIDGHQPELSASQQTNADAYVAALRATPERPPQTSVDPDVLAYLVEHGMVVDTRDGLVFDGGAFASMQARVTAHLQHHGAISLAEARDLLGTSRRHAQAILEHLDRLRVTRRVGEGRVLR